MWWAGCFVRGRAKGGEGCPPRHRVRCACCAVVAAEVEYLAEQHWQLPILHEAMEEGRLEHAGGCGGTQGCSLPGCGEHEAEAAAVGAVGEEEAVVAGEERAHAGL